MALDMESGRRMRGELEQDIKRVTDSYVTGELTLADGELLTPYRIAVKIKESQELEAPPSPGAVTATLKRWRDLDFAVLNDKPLAFQDYTDLGREVGLQALKARAAEGRKPFVKKDEIEVEMEADASEGSSSDEPVGVGEYPLP